LTDVVVVVALIEFGVQTSSLPLSSLLPIGDVKSQSVKKQGKSQTEGLNSKPVTGDVTNH
jgi:hypothetical protein